MDYSPLLGTSVVIEGPDFSGKTALVEGLKAHYESLGVKVRAYRQPGATPLGEAIRKVLFQSGFDDMNTLAERMLFAADHAEFVAKILRPNKESRSSFIICDRYSPISNLVYGVCGDGVSLRHAQELGRIAQAAGSLKERALCADLIIILEVLEDVAIQRAETRAAQRGEVNRLDAKDLKYKRRIAQGYNRSRLWSIIPQEEFEALRYIDGNGTQAETLARAIFVIDAYVARANKSACF